jgi:hypothetical protein
MRASVLLSCVLEAGCLIDRDLYDERYTELGGVDTAGGLWGVRFDDPLDCIAASVGDIVLDGTFTFDTYLRAQAAPGPDVFPVASWSGAFAIYQDAKGYLVVAPGDEPDPEDVVTSPVSLFDGAYHHLAVTYGQSGYASLYLDGARLAFAPADLGAAPHDTLYLGCWPDEGVSFRGDIGEARLSSAAFYGSDFTPGWIPYEVASATLALWHLDEGEGRTTYDVTGNAKGTLEPGMEWVPFPLAGERPR